MPSFRVIRKAVPAAAVALIIVAIGTAARSQAPAPYEINVILPLTGFAAFIGKGDQATLQVLEPLVNQQGGVRGRPVKFVIADDTSSPQVAVQLTNALIAKKVPVIIGSALAPMCDAMLPLLANGPVEYCLSSLPDPPAGSYQFVVLWKFDDQIETFLHYARARGWTRLAAIVGTDTNGQRFDLAIARLLAKPELRAITLVSHEHVNVNDQSATAQVARVKSSNAQVLIDWTTGTSFGTVLRSSLDADISLPVFVTGADCGAVPMRTYAPLLPAEMYCPGGGPEAPSVLTGAAVKRALSQYQDAMRANNLPTDSTTYGGWDPVLLIVNALRKYGTDATAAQIRDYIASYKGPSVLGNFDFPAYPQRGVNSTTSLILRWDPAGAKFNPVSKLGGAPL